MLASASHFLHSLAFNLYLHLSGFLKIAGTTEETIGLIFGVTGAAAILVRPPMGRVMDERGRVLVLRLGGLLHVLVCLLYSTVTGAGLYVATVRVAHGIAEAMLFTSLFTFASDIVPASRRFEGIALFGVSGLLPISIAPLLGDILLMRGGGPSIPGYRQIFMLSVALSGVAFLLSLPLREPVREGGDEPTRGMWAAFRQADLVPLWIAGGVFAMCVAAMFTFFATFVMEEKIGSVGLFFSCYSIAAVLLRILGGKLPERVGPKKVLFPALGSFAIGLLLLMMAKSAAYVAVAGVIAGFGHGYTFPILLGLLVSRARSTERGAALAIFTSLFDAGTLLGGPIFGTIVRATGSYRAMFATAAAIVVAGTAVFAVLDRRRS